MKTKIKGLLMVGVLLASVIVGNLSVYGESADDSVANVPESEVEKIKKETVTLNIHPLQYEHTNETGDVYNDKGKYALPNQQNTGKEMILNEKFSGGTPISDVSFKVYDITAYYNEGENTFKENDTTKKITPGKIQKDYYYQGNTYLNNNNINEAQDIVISKIEDNTVTQISQLPVYKDGKFAAYLIVQDQAGSGILNKAYPMVVTMPVYSRNDDGSNKTNGTFLSTINLYPKMEKGSLFGGPTDPVNPTDEEENTPITAGDATQPNYVNNEGTRQSVDYDQTILYGFDVTLPRGEVKNGDYVININNPDSKLSLYKNNENDDIKNSFKLNTNNQTPIPPSDYDIGGDDVAGYKITFKKNGNYDPNNGPITLDGKTITVTFALKLKSNAAPDKDYTTQVSAKLPYQQNNIDNYDKPGSTSVNGDLITYNLKSVYTGGSHFKVIDSNASNGTVAIDNFITNSRFFVTKTVGTDTYVAQLADASTGTIKGAFVSDEQKTLKLSNWENMGEITPNALNEKMQKMDTTTPNPAIIDFNVEDTNISDKDKRLNTTFSIQGLKDAEYEVHQIKSHDLYVNPKAKVLDFTVDGGKEQDSQSGQTTTFAKTSQLADYEPIRNVKKGFLPSTGGTGILIFLVVGVALMGGSYLWFKRSKDSAEV